ncbi:Colicin V secretion protein CvaA [Cedecea lapagei]|uniref:Colicin V secretion protein CvaA n=1 Tax=Cedecea lapagei TaxID=158823 RepID=A0A3S4IBX4_9ENTR|nr:HlyD family secretion protein [Cedecea lapagei]VEB95412.1 Colicin V secretion protein CvaA [Cedecea lapagei]
MEKRSLFRQEAIDNFKTRWLGQALLIGRYPAWIIVLITFAFISVLLFVIIFCDYTRRINVQGEVTSLPRAVNVFSPSQGFISHSWKQAGERVKKGDYLYQIDVARVTHSGNVSENSLRATQQQTDIIKGIILKLEENKEVTLSQMTQQLAQYESAYRHAKELVESAKKGMIDMKSTMDNYAEYKRRGLINSDQMTNQRYLYYQQQSVYQNLNSQMIQQGLQITSLKGDMLTRATDFDNQISQRRYELSDLQRRLAEMDATGTLFVSAPVDGKVESMSVTQGQMTNIGDSLAQIVPAESQGYFLVLWLPDSSIPYVKVGDNINVRYEAFPFEKFGQFAGKILSISSVPASPQELSSYSNSPQTQQTRAAQPFYKAIVDISHDRRLSSLTLTTGMKAQAMVFMEKRPLYQWMLSPFYDIHSSLMGPIDG